MTAAANKVRTALRKNRGGLIALVVVDAALIMSVLFLLYSLYFLYTFQNFKEATSYFPWAWGASYSSSSQVEGVFVIGLGISLVCICASVIAASYLISIRGFSFSASRRKPGPEEVAQAADTVTEKVAQAADTVTEKVAQAADTVTEKVQMSSEDAAQGGEQKVVQSSGGALLQEQKKRRREEFHEARREARLSKTPESLADRFIRFAVRLTGGLNKYVTARVMPGLGTDILRSNLNIAPEGIVAISIFMTFLYLPFAIVITYLLFESGNLLIAVFFPISIVLPFVIGLNLPKASSSSRGSFPGKRDSPS